MQIISFNGYDFEANDFETGIDYAAGRAQWSLVPNIEQRLNAPGLFTGSQVTARPVPVNIIYRGADTYEHAFTALMGALDPLNPEPRTLIAEMNDGTEVSCEAVVILPGGATQELDINIILVTFLTTDPFWTETALTTDGPDTINAGAPTTVIVNSGSVPVAPVIERSAPTVDFTSSMTFRRRVTITNNGDLPLERETMIVPAEYASGWGYPRMLKDGTYHPVTSMRNGASGWPDYHAFPATVDSGESETFDLVSQSSPPPDLDTFTRFDGNYSALDLGWEKRDNITSATTTTITVSGAAWPVNRWRFASLVIVGGTGVGQARKINSNTATVLTVARAFTTTPDATSDIMLYAGGWLHDGGRASSATSPTLTVLTISGTFSPTPDATTTYRIERPGVHRYYVEKIKHSESHRGGWQINKRFTKPSKKLWGNDVLNGWGPYTMLDNGDDFNQLSVTATNLGGSDIDYFPILNASRWRGADTRKQEEGQGDGVAIHHPWGYSRITYDYQMVNQNSAPGATTGIGKFVLMGREAGGDEFEEYDSDDTLIAGPALTEALEATVDLQPFGNPVDLYMGALPVNDIEISREAREADKINVQWGDTLILYVDTYNKFSYSVAAVSNVIPIQDEIRIGDYALQIGMRDGQRLYVETDQTLHLDCENARAWIEEGGIEVEDVTYAVTPVVYDGSSYQVSDRWPVLEPGNNTVTFDGDPWASNGAFTATFTFRERIYG
jgi:hypothetical protein